MLGPTINNSGQGPVMDGGLLRRVPWFLRVTPVRIWRWMD